MYPINKAKLKSIDQEEKSKLKNNRNKRNLQILSVRV